MRGGNITRYEIELETTPIKSIQNVGKHQKAYNAIGIGEYFDNTI